MKKFILIFLFINIALYAVAQTYSVVIHTNKGDIRATLFDDTPRHRNEFVRLARAGHFNGTLFYRSVRDFVIQGGSSDSRNAPAGKHIGYGDEAINIDSEFSKKHYHKRGALCAPRQPDKVNMLKTSDISQFYIVCGKVYPDSLLDKLERVVNNPIKKRLRKLYYEPNKEKLAELKATDKVAYNALVKEIREKMDFEYAISGYKEFTPEQRADYTSIGGAPELDNEYTVFGQVTSGIDIVLRINKIKTDKNERPIEDVKIISIDVIEN